MSNKDLRRNPYLVKDDDDAWWYEDGQGIEIFVKHKNDDGTYKFKDTHFVITWRQIRSMLKRKDT